MRQGAAFLLALFALGGRCGSSATAAVSRNGQVMIHLPDTVLNQPSPAPAISGLTTLLPSPPARNDPKGAPRVGLAWRSAMSRGGKVSRHGHRRQRAASRNGARL